MAEDAMTLHDLIFALAGALVALVAMVLGRRRAKPAPKPPPPPKHTAQEYDNATTTHTADAVSTAADDHGVHPGVVAADLDWLESDDV